MKVPKHNQLAVDILIACGIDPNTVTKLALTCDAHNGSEMVVTYAPTLSPDHRLIESETVRYNVTRIEEEQGDV